MSKKTVQTTKVAEYGLVSFCQALMECLEEGYRFDFDKNEGVPQNFGGFFEVELYKTTVEQSEQSKATQVPTEVEQTNQEVPSIVAEDSQDQSAPDTDETTADDSEPEISKGKTVRTGRKAKAAQGD